MDLQEASMVIMVHLDRLALLLLPLHQQTLDLASSLKVMEREGMVSVALRDQRQVVRYCTVLYCTLL